MTSSDSKNNIKSKNTSLKAFKVFGKKILTSNSDGSSDSQTSTKSDNNKSKINFFNGKKSGSKTSKQSSTHTIVKPSKAVADLIAQSSNPFVSKEKSAGNKSATSSSISSLSSNAKSSNYNVDALQSLPKKLSFTSSCQSSLKSQRMAHNPYAATASLTNSTIGNTSKNITQQSSIISGKKQEDLSFYMQDGDKKIRILPSPLGNPNDFLPTHMKQTSIQLTGNFTLDKDYKLIGSGGSSDVCKVVSTFKKKEIYALKKLNMVYDETPERFYKRCSKEFIISKHLSSSKNIHIVNTFYLLKIATTTYTTRGWGFIMELCSKDLFNLIQKTGWRNVPLSEKYCLFKQIVEGVKFMHEQGVAHRDLKPENVLLTQDGICKITDFGISDWYHIKPLDFSSPVKKCAGMIGSAPYASPEVMMYDAKKKYPESLQIPYDPLKLDSYSLGIILITMVNNIIPFLNSCNKDAKFRKYVTSYENFIRHQNSTFRQKGCYKAGPGAEYTLAKNFKNTAASRVAWRLADPNPETRYTMEDLVNDPWYKSIETCVDNIDGFSSCTTPKIKDELKLDYSENNNENDSMFSKLDDNNNFPAMNADHTHRENKAMFILNEDSFDEKQVFNSSNSKIPESNPPSTPKPLSTATTLASINYPPISTNPHTMLPLRRFSEMSIGSRASTVSTNGRTLVSASTDSSISIRNGNFTSRRKRKVVHNHMHIVNSVTGMSNIRF
ncbi:putative serine/threonine protein kinase PTK1 NDAI_0D01450 [Naumovozyma dairenensis CBS 421]|uniref:non-specific serine/threonine protein kinase n=1 Tax=Naumovozyma dairenensis (strain ATCC 10597 / BCRC 20456 / CBS 421 / NBRC 0211 / NRRL Y-12639) TaxID=1071378 RepID=G0W9J8_NAUDC|nr:hypothetical protein NDAI_0D01450 [Naumovozyma dairenensis CBS 421]CCD24459.1 hypothetical protein NDAI_0D01450 [Naumovozyma dairenensis CBS 421]